METLPLAPTDGFSEPARHLARPGGPIPKDAANRIPRPEDRQLLIALEDAPFTAAVTGPPECGKSTLLQILAEQARHQGFAVAEFDATIVLPAGAGPGDEENLSNAFFRELAGEAGRALGEQPEEKERWTRFDLLRFLKDTRLRGPEPPLLIVVDHAFRVPLALEELIQVCRSLDAQKCRTQMSWAIEVSDLPGSDPVGVLSPLAPSPQVMLGSFNPTQVRALAAEYGLSDEAQLENLWDWFAGQPFLTHVALTRWRDSMLAPALDDVGEPWNSITQEVARAECEFGRHLSRVRSRLRHYRPDGEIGEELQGDPNLMRLLAAFGMTDGSGKLVEFYRHHIVKL